MTLTTIIILGIFLAALIAGIALLFLGIRGKLIDKHPRCIDCRYDLSGRWPDIDKCPECGRKLPSESSIWREHRRRRPVMITVGAGLLFLAIIALIQALGAGPNLTRYKPTTWLILEARYGYLSLSESAISELQDRINANQLSAAAIASFVEHGLKRQANLNAEWPHAWGDVIESRHALGNLTDAQWETYLHQGLICDMETRERIRHGDEWYLSMPLHARFGENHTFLEGSFISATSGSTSQKMEPAPCWGFEAGYPVGEYWVGVWRPIDLPPGKHHVTVSILNELWDDYGGATLGQWVTEHKTQVTVLPSGKDSVTPITDESLRAEIEQKTTCDMERYHVAGYKNPVAATVRFEDLPMGVAFDVYLRVDGEERRAGMCSRSARKERHGFCFNVDYDNRDFDSADIILRPSAASARQSLDVYEFWNGEIIIEDAPINTPDFMRSR